MNSQGPQVIIIKPKLIKGIESAYIQTPDIKDEDVYRDVYISDCKIENQKASRVSFEGVVFKKVDFKGTTLMSLELTDVRFENCDLSNADFSGAIIHRTEFINCKLTGLNLSDVTLHNIYLQHCNSQFAVMSFAQMKDVIIEDCAFERSNFQNCKFKKVQLRNCNFKLSQMSGTSLLGVDLSNSNVEGLGVRPEDLRGAIVSTLQAVDFSKLLGLVIKE